MYVDNFVVIATKAQLQSSSMNLQKLWRFKTFIYVGVFQCITWYIERKLKHIAEYRF